MFGIPRVFSKNLFFFSSRRRHTRCSRDWSSDVCSSDLAKYRVGIGSKGMLVADQVNLLMSRPLGVKEVTNPSAPTGAEDPEQLDGARQNGRSEEHTSELQSRLHLVCRLLLEKKTDRHHA